MASKTKRARLLIALMAVLLLALPMTAAAASPHFIKASASIDGSGALVLFHGKFLAHKPKDRAKE